MLVCPRCQRANPAEAVFCHFDGAELRPVQGKSASQSRVRLPHDFVFPSGRRCRSFDELVQGCLSEWDSSRDLLRQGVFGQFLAGVGRTDLAQAAQQAKREDDPDLALDTFISRLPATVGQGPQLDLHPRRLNLGSFHVSETREIKVTIQNQGKGLLHGTISVAEGTAWLGVGSGKTNGECSIKTRSIQEIILRVDTRALSAPQKYSGKLTVITNGGIVEVPVRLDVAVQAFSRSPFQGVGTPREMAERMRTYPKLAVPLLESGEIAAWFGSNGWTYPVSGPTAKGVAGVQQFFEGMGLSKPPVVHLAETNLQLFCNAGETVAGQFTLRTEARKWVYAKAEADVGWIKIGSPSVTGPQQAVVSFEANARNLQPDQAYAGNIRVTANAGQELELPVRLGVLAGAAESPSRTVHPVAVGVAAGILLRLFLALPADIYARVLADSSGGSSSPGSLISWTQPADGVPDFAKHFVISTFWVGAVLGAFILARVGRRTYDILCGAIAGIAAGFAGSATIAVLLPTFDLLPRFLIQKVALSFGNSVVSGMPWLWTPIWIVLAALCWGVGGGVLGAVFGALGQKDSEFIAKISGWVARILGFVGLKQASAIFRV